MDKQRKKRHENWTQEEKETLRRLVSKSVNIIENKSNKSIVNNLKAKEWKILTAKFNKISGRNISDTQIKLAWKRIKLADKANLSAHTQQQYLSGDGAAPHSPSPDEDADMAIAPDDFIVDVDEPDDSDVVQVVISSEFDPHKEYIKCKDSTLLREIPSSNNVDSVTLEEANEPNNYSKINNCNRFKKTPRKINHNIRESIIRHQYSNINLKRKQLEMLEKEHTLNVKIAKLKILKLELQVALLQKELL